MNPFSLRPAPRGDSFIATTSKLLCLCLFACAVASAQAATFTVTNTNDSGAGSLRAAIGQANANPDVDIIVFAAGVSGTINTTGGSALNLNESVTIVGPGAATLTVNGNGARVAFPIVNAGRTVEISGLTIASGSTGGFGGGISLGNSTLRERLHVLGKLCDGRRGRDWKRGWECHGHELHLHG